MLKRMVAPPHLASPPSEIEAVYEGDQGQIAQLQKRIQVSVGMGGWRRGVLGMCVCGGGDKRGHATTTKNNSTLPG